MAKKKMGRIKFMVPAAKATPSPPVGPALGQKGIPSKAFCDQFNALTANFKKVAPGTAITTKVEFFDDKSFNIIVHSNISTSSLIKKYTNVTKGSQKPGHESAGVLTIDILKQIVEAKNEDIRSLKALGLAKSICGTAKSMGIKCPTTTELNTAFEGAFNAK